MHRGYEKTSWKGLISLDKNIGRIRGDLKIISFSHKDKNDMKLYEVECVICHRRKIMSLGNFNRACNSHERCSFLIEEKVSKRFRTIFIDMIQRTTNPNSKSYKNYGYRGIKSEWKYFVDFYDDMYESYKEHVAMFGEKQTTLDRINNNGNYSKANCKWSDKFEQAANTRKNKWFLAISPNGIEYKTKCQRKFAREHNLEYSYINKCLNNKVKQYKGWKFYYLEGLDENN